ncbi:MAG: ECF transporter S component [Clostridia bacterium]|nr:ECF transporter S component [Clostridia bacterium]
MDIVKKNKLRCLILAAMFLAIGLVLPFFTGQIPQIGKLLLPMHLPIFLCGMICGWHYGYAVGFILPLMRSLLFQMPVLYPTALAMAIELSVYGLAAGFIYELIKKKNIVNVYVSLVSAMLLGRAVSGAAKIVLYGTEGSPYTWQMFMTGAFANALPGILLQIIIVPAVMSAVHIVNKKTGWL